MSAHEEELEYEGEVEEVEGEGEESGREWLANKGGEEREEEQEEENDNDVEAIPDTDGFEELKAAMEKHSGAPLYCDVCKVDCNSQESFDKHMVGKKHEKEVKKLKAKGGKVEEKKEDKPKEPKYYTKEDYDNYYEGSEYWCDVCEVECTGEDSWNAHMVGVKHKKKLQSYDCLKRIERSGEYYKYDPDSQAYWCLTCDLEVTSPQVLEQHFKSQKHKQTLQDCGMLPPEPKGGRKRMGGPGLGMGMGPPSRPFMDAPGYGGGYDRFGPGPRGMMDPWDRMDPRDRMGPRDRLGPRDRDRYEEMEPLYTRRGAAVASAGNQAAVLVSNLHPCVSGEDLEELFCTIGKVASARKIREGVAEIVFLDAENAYRAKEMFNNRPLDGQPMYVDFMPDTGSSGESYGPRGGYGMSARDRLGPSMGDSAMDRLGPMGGGARDRLGPMGGGARDRLGPMDGGPRDRMGDRMGPMGGSVRDRMGPMGGGASDRYGSGPMGGGARDRLGPMSGGPRDRAAPVGGRWGY